MSNRAFAHLVLAVVFATAALTVSYVSAERPKIDVPAVVVRPVDTPPASFASALDNLREADAGKRKKAAVALATLEDAEPYVRHYSYSVHGKANAGVEELLDGYEVGRAKRNVDRAPDWAKGGRYDLLVDVCLHLTSTDQLKEVGQAFFDFSERFNSLPAELRGRSVAPGLNYTMKTLDQRREVRHFHQKAGTVKTDWINYGLVRAQSCEASAVTRLNWLVLTRNHLKGTNERANIWENCYIFHNSDLELDDLSTSFVVCDGDVDQINEWSPSSSVIIANGTIRRNGGIGAGSRSTYFASGDIVTRSGVKHDSLFLAGGDIIDAKTGKPRTGVENEKPGLKENPFGVRFFATADVGVELALKENAVTVAKLTPGSPLTKYGVEVGDVITQVNDKPAKTLNDVRRELRYSVALEAGIFHITRGQEKLTRVVYFKNGLEK